ncbi:MULTISPECIES: hypothetical protein [Paenibacillus]|uniref:hypothetical protein n=1 Tax=Paenibacillus TaxID=44249 RepID=UPI001C8D2000|nr:hypothetical protein [Paenibacillus xylanexedens]MBY0117954.1 hypothetical protein [Paenibacillus xylanexedens]
MADWRHAAGEAPRLSGRGAFCTHHGYALVMLQRRAPRLWTPCHPVRCCPIGRSTSPLRGLPLHKPRSAPPFKKSYVSKASEGRLILYGMKKGLPFVFKVTPEELEEVKREIKAHMTYYNHYRYQWNLKKDDPYRVQFKRRPTLS